MKILLSVLIIIPLVSSLRKPCTEYGCPGRPRYEPFVPAPPGHTPRCAKPGQTFCESPDHYPRQLIKFLVDKCSFDFSTVLRDESREDFNIYRSVPEDFESYDYPEKDYGDFQGKKDPRIHSQTSSTLPSQYPLRGQPSLIYGVPSNDTRQDGYRYTTPVQSSGSPFRFDVTPSGKYRWNKQPISDHPIHTQPQSLNLFGQVQPTFSNRYAGNDKVAPRSMYENPLLGYVKIRNGRTKRQSNPDSIVLCPTEAQYITPKAALNNQGNWMYVVNIQDQDQKYSQFVRSERCTTDVCNGVCSVPAGYTSKCQQQYVQKRLVALEGSGNRLYTDVFWFPHGCSCQITLNY